MVIKRHKEFTQFVLPPKSPKIAEAQKLESKVALTWEIMSYDPDDDDDPDDERWFYELTDRPEQVEPDSLLDLGLVVAGLLVTFYDKEAAAAFEKIDSRE